MKIFESYILAIILTICIAGSYAQRSAVARASGSIRPSSSNNSVERSCEEGDMGPKCADCNTMLTCFGNLEIERTSCSTYNVNRPYCVNNACAESTTEQCISKTFLCTGQGQYPDPYDCSRYYLCDQPGGKAFIYECPPGHPYNSKTGLCNGKQCRIVNCSQYPNQYVLYPSDPSIMAFCRSTPEKEAILFRCQDPKNFQFDATTLKCVFKCPSVGRFPDELDPQSYYECYQNGTSLLSDRQTCPPSYQYNFETQICALQGP